MDYSRKKLRELKKENDRVRGSIENRFSMLVLRLVLIAGVILAVLGTYRLLDFARRVIGETPSIKLVLQPVETATVILDMYGNETGSFSLSDLSREDVALEEVPEEVRQAFIDWLDDDFYERNGVQLADVLNIFLDEFQESSSRAEPDTITERLIENTVYMNWTSGSRYDVLAEQFQELVMASRLEQKYSKEWILEHYLNSALFGEDTVGIQAASKRYFGKDVSELTLSEGTVLAAIIGAPTDRDPLLDEEANAACRKEILEKMARLGHLDSERAAELSEDSVYRYLTGVSQMHASEEMEQGILSTAFGRLLKDSIIRGLVSQHGYTQEQAELIFYHGGLTVYSSQDTEIQQIAEDAVSNEQNYPEESGYSLFFSGTYKKADGTIANYSELDMMDWMEYSGNGDSLVFSSLKEAEKAEAVYQEYLRDHGTEIAVKVTYTRQPQASAVVIEQQTGLVRAVVSRREDEHTEETSQIFNRAADQYTNGGSMMNVLSVYGPALDSQYYTMSSVINDVYGTGEKGVNSLTIRDAIATQNDSAAANLFQAITRETSYESMLKYNFSYMKLEEDIGQRTEHMPAAGVSNLELTAAYAAVASGGAYLEPMYYSSVWDESGEVLLTSGREARTAMKDTTAYLLTSAMQDAVDHGTASGIKLENIACAGQVGTGDDDDSSWCVAFTPKYTCGILSCYDAGNKLTESDYTMRIWSQIMVQINDDEPAEFMMPEGIRQKRICLLSGKNAINGVCKGSYVEYYAKGTESAEMCDLHETAVICKESGLLAGPDCPEEDLEPKVFVKGSKDPEEQMPTEICNLHTGEIAGK